MPTNIRTLRTEAKTALTEMAKRLVALADETGDLVTESRRILLLTNDPGLWPHAMVEGPSTDHRALDRALSIVGEVSSFLDNWADCSRDRRPTPQEQSEAYGNAAALARDLAKLLDKRGLVGRSQIVNDAAPLLEERRQELFEQEEPERDRRGREFAENFLEPAVQATSAAVKALCALADALCTEA